MSSAAANFARAARQARQALAASVPAPPSAERALGFAFAPGDRVIDTRTGEEVVIDAGYQVTDHVPIARSQVD